MLVNSMYIFIDPAVAEYIQNPLRVASCKLSAHKYQTERIAFLIVFKLPMLLLSAYL